MRKASHTGSDNAVTIGDEIFFPKDIDLSSENHIGWIAHELAHCLQYRRYGGVANFLHRFIPQVAQGVIGTRSLNVHDIRPLEVEAKSMRDWVLAGILERRVPPPVATSYGPSLAVFRNCLYAAWKGADDDQGIYWSSFDGMSWTAQSQMLNRASSHGPALAVFSRSPLCSLERRRR